jgi:hypothetical protein
MPLALCRTREARSTKEVFMLFNLKKPIKVECPLHNLVVEVKQLGITTPNRWWLDDEGRPWTRLGLIQIWPICSYCTCYGSVRDIPSELKRSIAAMAAAEKRKLNNLSTRIKSELGGNWKVVHFTDIVNQLEDQPKSEQCNKAPEALEHAHKAGYTAFITWLATVDGVKRIVVAPLDDDGKWIAYTFD